MPDWSASSLARSSPKDQETRGTRSRIPGEPSSDDRRALAGSARASRRLSTDGRQGGRSARIMLGSPCRPIPAHVHRPGSMFCVSAAPSVPSTHPRQQGPRGASKPAPIADCERQGAIPPGARRLSRCRLGLRGDSGARRGKGFDCLRSPFSLLLLLPLLPGHVLSETHLRRPLPHPPKEAPSFPMSQTALQVPRAPNLLSDCTSSHSGKTTMPCGRQVCSVTPSR